MKWPTFWPKALLLLLLVVLEGQQWFGSSKSGVVRASHWTARRKLDAREKTRNLWYHGFDSYMRYAFPLDELAPLSCTGRGPDWENPANIATNDVAGNFSVTLIDALDTLVVLNDPAGFEKAVRNVIDWVSFDVNTKPQVFETTIRVLGGLLSGHQFANETGQPFHIPWYNGQLLDLARDLGDRLLPAFKTPTGLPYARINLRHGITKGESIETCTAGAGSLILEFGILSRLTGDDRYEKAAHKAFFAIWNRKSDIGLVGNTVNIVNGAWLTPEISSVGAGIDSFFEYALKWYILSGEVEFLDVFQESYASIMRYARAPDGFWYRSANIHTGDIAYTTFDSLSAFWPGLQVLAGDIENAVKSHLIYWNIWKNHSGLPEVWDMGYRVATSFQYPLRPEFVESTWYLYRATRDPFYLDVGERILYDIILRAKVDCGLTGIGDLRTNRRDDRMESFVLSETLKYLYLLFDEENSLHSDDSNYVLTTEGHILKLAPEHQKPISAIRKKLRGVEHHQCPAYRPPILAYDGDDKETGLIAGISSRVDFDWPRFLTGAQPSDKEVHSWSSQGWCQVPRVDLFSYDFVMSPHGKSVPEDTHPTSEKLFAVSDGYVVQNVTGIRAHVVSRLDGKGYDVTKLGSFSVKTGQLVYVNDSDLVTVPKTTGKGGKRRATEAEMRFYMAYVDPALHIQAMPVYDPVSEIFVTASTAMFGGDPTASDSPDGPLFFGHGEGVRLARDISNPHGCSPYENDLEGAAVVVQRGECTFLEKLWEATMAGASGVIAISSDDQHINPSAGAEELTVVGDTLNHTALVVVNRQDGLLITGMLDMAERLGTGQVMMAIIPVVQPAVDSDAPTHTPEQKRARAKSENRILYLNGHPLQNTRLMA